MKTIKDMTQLEIAAFICSHLKQHAIESDYQTFHLAQDRISIDQKLQYIASNDAIFVRYKQNVDLIEACAPICNVDTP